MQRVQTPMIPVVGEWIAQHPGTISLGQGIVHYAPPHEAKEAAANAMLHESRIDRYCLVRGIDDLLEKLEAKLREENQIELCGSSVVVTAGSNMAFQNAVLAIADEGDEIILLSPYYFNHEMAIAIAGCKPVIVPTNAQYQIELDRLEAAITDRTRAIVTVSPSNPTGAVYTRESLEAVNALCRKQSIFHISDEAYEYFIYGGQTHFSPASLPNTSEHTISMYSFSKAYGMAGWRVGYMVVPNQLEVPIKKIQDTNLVCPPVLNQIAASAALDAGRSWCEQQIRGFEDVRNLVAERLDALGDRCDAPQPEGAFYTLAKMHTDRQDMDLVESLIRQFGVAVMPGQTFGVDQGCSLRIAYGALEQDTVSEGMGRLTRGLEKLL